MTKTARLILQDAKYAIDKYSDELQGADFRIRWLAIITLLRAVGHGLNNVDAKTSSKMKLAVEVAHKKSEFDEMFLFIKKERDRFIKNYEHGVMQSTYAIGHITKKDGSPGTFRLNISNPVNCRLDTTDGRYQSVIVDGPFAGKGGKFVVLQAYEWWLNYLDDVDRQANT